MKVYQGNSCLVYTWIYDWNLGNFHHIENCQAGSYRIEVQPPNWQTNDVIEYTVRVVSAGEATISGDGELSSFTLLQNDGNNDGVGNTGGDDSTTDDSSNSDDTNSDDTNSDDSNSDGSNSDDSNSDDSNSDDSNSDDEEDDGGCSGHSDDTPVQAALREDLEGYTDGSSKNAGHDLYAFQLDIAYVYAENSVYDNCYNIMSVSWGKGTCYDIGYLWYYAHDAEFVAEVGESP